MRPCGIDKGIDKYQWNRIEISEIDPNLTYKTGTLKNTWE